MSQSTFREPVHIGTAMEAALQNMRKLIDNKDGLTGLSTGLRDIDEATHGLQRSDLILLASRPAQGKTALMCTISRHAAIHQKLPVLIFSLKQSRESLAQLLLTTSANVRTFYGHWQDNDWTKLQQAQELLCETEIYIYDRSQTATDIAEKSRSLYEKIGGIGLIAIDHVQTLVPDRDNIKLRNTVCELKQLAVELDCPVVVLSELPSSIEHRKNKRPVISDAPWADDADGVMFLYRDDYYDQNTRHRGEVEVIIARQKFGPTGTVELLYQGSTATFHNK